MLALFLIQLANGINPIDDTEIKGDDVVNNVRMSRCFFYVSDILRQVIENGGISKKKNGWLQFNLSPQQLSNFSYSVSPIPISEIAKRLNSLITNESMRKISHRDLTNWLMSIGMLYEQTTYDDKTAKHPTKQGTETGISVETRTGQRGEYTVTVYDRNAQAFIVDNLDAIVALKYKK